MARRAGHSWYLSLGAGFFSLGFIVATTSSKTSTMYSTTYIRSNLIDAVTWHTRRIDHAKTLSDPGLEFRTIYGG
jgi:hypothetical protein